MNSTELLATFREETTDAVEPYLWSDALLFSFMNEAQNMFCRLTEGIEDSSTTDICRKTVAAGDEWLPVSPKVLKVRGVFNATTGRKYDVVPSEVATEFGIYFDGRQGPIRKFVSGLERNKLRAWPVATEDTDIELRVFRLPLVTLNSTEQEFEIDEQHHRALLMWMKYLAYGVEDADVFNRRKSDDYEQAFRAYCSKARVEQVRARHSAGTVSYGGI